MGDRIAILRDGGVLAQYDTPDGILGNPADEFVERFVGPDRALKRLALRQLGELELRSLDGTLPDSPRLPRDASQRTAISVLIGAHADRLVVTDGDGRELGLVTREDLVT